MEVTLPNGVQHFFSQNGFNFVPELLRVRILFCLVCAGPCNLTYSLCSLYPRSGLTNQIMQFAVHKAHSRQHQQKDALHTIHLKCRPSQEESSTCPDSDSQNWR